MAKEKALLPPSSVTRELLAKDVTRGGITYNQVDFTSTPPTSTIADNVIAVDCYSFANINLASLPATIDGISVVAGLTFLANNQTTSIQDNIYIVDSGATTASLLYTVLDKSFVVFIKQGTVYANKLFNGYYTSLGAYISGTTQLYFEKMVSRKDNCTAANPTVNDDITKDYEIFSLWKNTATSEIYMCLDATASAAIWYNLTVDALPAGTNTQTLRHNGTDWVASSLLRNDGTNVAVNAAPSTAQKMYVVTATASQRAMTLQSTTGDCLGLTATSGTGIDVNTASTYYAVDIRNTNGTGMGIRVRSSSDCAYFEGDNGAIINGVQACIVTSTISSTNAAIDLYSQNASKTGTNIYVLTTTGQNLSGVTSSGDNVYVVSTSGYNFVGVTSSGKNILLSNTSGINIDATSTNNISIVALSTNSNAFKFSVNTNTENIGTFYSGTGTPALVSRVKNNGMFEPQKKFTEYGYGADTSSFGFATALGYNSNVRFRTELARRLSDFYNIPSHRQIYAVKRTTDATTARLVIEADSTSQNLVVPTDCIWSFSIELLAMVEGFATSSYAISYKGQIRNYGGTMYMLTTGTPSQGGDLSGLSIALSKNDTDKTLDINVTGLAATSIEWHAFIDIFEIKKA